MFVTALGYTEKESLALVMMSANVKILLCPMRRERSNASQTGNVRVKATVCLPYKLQY